MDRIGERVTHDPRFVVALENRRFEGLPVLLFVILYDFQLKNITMINSTAKAQWNGVVKSGNGEMVTGGVPFPYSFNSRMEGGAGSTPEGMLAAALSGCYSMAISGSLERAGFPPQQVNTAGTAHFDNIGGAWTVVSIDLDVKANVPGIDDAKFQEIAQATKSTCPVSRALTAVQINVSASLV